MAYGFSWIWKQPPQNYNIYDSNPLENLNVAYIYIYIGKFDIISQYGVCFSLWDDELIICNSQKVNQLLIALDWSKNTIVRSLRDKLVDEPLNV